MTFITDYSKALLRVLEASHNQGRQSVADRTKKRANGDFSVPNFAVVLQAGNPTASAFFKMQSFTTAAVKEADVRRFMGEALAGNLEQGGGKRDFARLVDQEFDRQGLTRLKPHQIENIYTTNTSLAYGAGQMATLMETAGDFPFWRFSATMDGSTRPEHAALHGKIFPVGDFTFYPPLGYRCRCTAIPLTARQAGRYPKSEMPEGTEREALRSQIGAGEFVGNKQKNYLDWLGKQYQEADTQTRTAIDQAIDQFKTEIEAETKVEPIAQEKAPAPRARATKAKKKGTTAP